MSYNAVPTSYDEYLYHPILEFLPKRLVKPLKKSPDFEFGNHIFPLIDPRPYMAISGKENSAPHYPFNILVAALIYKAMYHLSDNELVQKAVFDQRTRYALHIIDDAVPFSVRTLERFRAELILYESETGIDLLKNSVLSVAQGSAELLGTNRFKKRMDSSFVDVFAKNLTRFELLYRVVRAFVAALNNEGYPIEEPFQHYLKDFDWNEISYHDKATSQDEKIARVIADGLALLRQFALDERTVSWSEFQLLRRVFEEQLIEEDGQFRLRKDKSEGLHSKTVQNPADPDATFRKKAGESHQGYALNVCESGSGKTSIITDFEVAPNITSDTEFLKNHLESLPDKEEGDQITVIAADGAYDSKTLDELKAQKGVQVKTTNTIGRKSDPSLALFEVNEEETEILYCPNKIRPLSSRESKDKGYILAHFPKKDCENCPMKAMCPCKPAKKSYSIRLSKKGRKRAADEQERGTREYTEVYKYRNGVECVFSILKSSYGLNRIPVRGLHRVKQFVTFKIGGLNAKKVCSFMLSSKKEKLENPWDESAQNLAFGF